MVYIQQVFHFNRVRINEVSLQFCCPYKVWERMKLVIEPSAAVAVAAVLSQQFREVVGSSPQQLKVGVVLCGGNLNLDSLPWMTS